jgi:hypothetical protein
MRKDPYQDRARELCAAAGIDPDSRVGEGRGAPAWCSYRNAASAELNARVRGLRRAYSLGREAAKNPDAKNPYARFDHRQCWDEGRRDENAKRTKHKM